MKHKFALLNCHAFSQSPPSWLQVLREVPLPATELDVCRAVEQWALSYYGDDLDDSSPDLAEEEDPIIPNDEDRAILDLIDLSCIKSIDIKTVRFSKALCFCLVFLVLVYLGVVCG